MGQSCVFAGFVAVRRVANVADLASLSMAVFENPFKRLPQSANYSAYRARKTSNGWNQKVIQFSLVRTTFNGNTKSSTPSIIRNVQTNTLLELHDEEERPHQSEAQELCDGPGCGALDAWYVYS